jgi:hypothetical protein
MKKELLKLAERLDDSGLYSEADVVTGLLKKLSQDGKIEFDFSGDTDEEQRETLYRTAPSRGKSVSSPQVLISEYNMQLLSSSQIRMIQDGLNSAGFRAGSADGQWGERTDTAFKDAVWGFSLLAAETESSELIDTAPNSKLYNIALQISAGTRPSEEFTLDLILSMLRIIRDERAKGTYISAGRPIKSYEGSKGTGTYTDAKNTENESSLESTRPGGALRHPSGALRVTDDGNVRTK